MLDNRFVTVCRTPAVYIDVWSTIIKKGGGGGWLYLRHNITGELKQAHTTMWLLGQRVLMLSESSELQENTRQNEDVFIALANIH